MQNGNFGHSTCFWVDALSHPPSHSVVHNSHINLLVVLECVKSCCWWCSQCSFIVLLKVIHYPTKQFTSQSKHLVRISSTLQVFCTGICTAGRHIKCLNHCYSWRPIQHRHSFTYIYTMQTVNKWNYSCFIMIVIEEGGCFCLASKLVGPLTYMGQGVISLG